jgi:hypothetical protein
LHSNAGIYFANARVGSGELPRDIAVQKVFVAWWALSQAFTPVDLGNLIIGTSAEPTDSNQRELKWQTSFLGNRIP